MKAMYDENKDKHVLYNFLVTFFFGLCFIYLCRKCIRDCLVNKT